MTEAQVGHSTILTRHSIIMSLSVISFSVLYGTLDYCHHNVSDATGLGVYIRYSISGRLNSLVAEALLSYRNGDPHHLMDPHGLERNVFIYY